tara:strand:- start:121 stop:549 length:429 start_codon:yes stop_codon:yes gene_type:complete
MSTLNVDSLAGSSNVNVITVRGEGTATTSLQNGLAKSWARYQSSAVQDSLNQSSFQDLGTVNDNFVMGFTTNFDDKDHYCPIGQFRNNIDGPSSNPGALRISVGTDTNNCTTSQVGGSIANAAANAMLDWVAGQIVIHGDLA